MLFSVQQTLGAAAVGFFISCVVYGILTYIVGIYFQRFPFDRPVYKILVGSLWVLELIDQIFIGYSIYFYSVSNYLTPLVILTENVIWTLVLQVVMGCLVASIVKICFAIRVWRFSKKNPYIISGITCMILVQLAFATLYCVRAFQVGRVTNADKLRGIASVALGTGLGTDFAIAGTLCYFLAKLRTGFKGSDTLISTLTTYAVNTGLLTGAVCLLTVIVYNAKPNTFYFMATYFVLGKLYAISFICTLNTRKVVRGRGTDQNTSSTGMNSKHSRGGSYGLQNRPNPDYLAPNVLYHDPLPSKQVEIGVHREVAVVEETFDKLSDGERGRLRQGLSTYR